MAFELKNLEVLNLVRPLPTIAREVMREFGLNLITSAYRAKKKDSTHAYWRALDFRCRNRSQGALVEDYINGRWIYDPTRPDLYKVCRAHGKGTEFHIHLQVHPRTKRRKGG